MILLVRILFLCALLGSSACNMRFGFQNRLSGFLIDYEKQHNNILTSKINGNLRNEKASSLQESETEKKIRIIRNSTRKLKLFYKFLLSINLIKKTNEESLKKTNNTGHTGIITTKCASSFILIALVYCFSRFFHKILCPIINSQFIQTIIRLFITMFHRHQSFDSITETDSETIDFDRDFENIFSLIDYINNGLTNIWLQCTSKADQLLLDLPVLLYCECFDGHSEEELTIETSHYYVDDKFYKCDCGKNDKKIMITTSAIQKLRTNECSICLENFELSDYICQLPCRHNFHRRCIYNWFLTGNYKCPFCRSHLFCKYSLNNYL